MLIEYVEPLIEAYYARIQVSGEMRQALAGMLHAEFVPSMASESAELASLAAERDLLDEERAKLLQAHYAGAVPLELLKREQGRISNRLEAIEHRINAHHEEYASSRENPEDSLVLLANVSLIYGRCDDANRRICNQAFFRKIFIDEDGEARAEYQRPYVPLCDAGQQANALNWAAAANEGAVAASANAETKRVRPKSSQDWIILSRV